MTFKALLFWLDTEDTHWPLGLCLDTLPQQLCGLFALCLMGHHPGPHIPLKQGRNPVTSGRFSTHLSPLVAAASSTGTITTWTAALEHEKREQAKSPGAHCLSWPDGHSSCLPLWVTYRELLHLQLLGDLPSIFLFWRTILGLNLRPCGWVSP